MSLTENKGFMLSSNEIPPNTGCQSGGRRVRKKSRVIRRRINKSKKQRQRQRGGSNYGFNTSSDIPIGTKGSYIPIKVQSNCGIENPLSHGTNIQHQYGGSNCARTGYEFDTEQNMSDFAGSYAPVRKMMGGKKKRKSTRKTTKKSTKKSSSKKNHKKSRKNKNLRKKNKSSKKNHKKSSKNKSLRKKHNNKKRHIQKGGYHQYMSNTPHSALYSTGNSGLTPSESMLANPTPYKSIDTCVDNYNHYTGKGFETPVLDQAPPVSK